MFLYLKGAMTLADRRHLLIEVANNLFGGDPAHVPTPVAAQSPKPKTKAKPAADRRRKKTPPRKRKKTNNSSSAS
jgi:hypothetical protein